MTLRGMATSYHDLGLVVNRGGASRLMLRAMQGILFAVTYACPCMEALGTEGDTLVENAFGLKLLRSKTPALRDVHGIYLVSWTYGWKT